MNADIADHIAACMDLLECAGRAFENAIGDEKLAQKYTAMVAWAQDYLECAMEAADAGRSHNRPCEFAMGLVQQLQHRAAGDLCPSEVLVVESHFGSIVTLLAGIMTTQSDEELERIFASPKPSAEFDALFPH